jgi:hypothetical protein
MSNSKTGPILIFLGLILILVVAPAGSWYYLSKGLDYRKASLAELKPLGKLPDDFVMASGTGQQLNASQLRKAISVHFTYTDEQARKQAFSIIASMYKQFKDRPDVFFVGYNLTGKPDSGAAFVDELSAMKIFAPNKCYFSISSDSAMVRRYLHADDLSRPIAALVDTAIQVRKVYQLDDAKQVSRLIEQTATIIPIIKKESATLKRGTEK